MTASGRIGHASRQAAFLAAALAAALFAIPDGGTAAADGEAGLPEFVEIPAGPFLMGTDTTCDPDAFDNERWSPSEG